MFRGGRGFPTAHATGPLPIHTERLHSPFHLQEGKVSLIENKFCNILYRRKLSNSKTYSVQEEMLCAGDFSKGKATCRVSFCSSLACLPQFPQRACVASALWRPVGLPVSPSPAVSPGSPLPKPHEGICWQDLQTASVVSTFQAFRSSVTRIQRHI